MPLPLDRRGLLLILLLAWGCSAQAAQADTAIFSYTGAEQTFTVPGGVTSVHVIAVGATGGDGDLSGGAAARVSAEVAVTPGQTLYVEVGGGGQDSLSGGAGGFNGGGNGDSGGGGASDVRTSPEGAGLSPDHRLIVAAGGGGAGGTNDEGTGGAGGAAGSSGSEGEGSGGVNLGGGAGADSAGGLGGAGCFKKGVDGTLGVGGDGGASSLGTAGPAGGGGGGYYGGGGGGGGCLSSSGGGGGGSSLVPAGGILETASLATPPQVQITYERVPPSIAIQSPANGATYTVGQTVSAAYSCAAPAGAGVKTCAGPVANGGSIDTSALGQHTFTVGGEDTDGATGEESVTYTVVAGTAPAVGDTILGSHPKGTVKTGGTKVKVTFKFSSTAAGATFECKLDNGRFAPCTSPKSYRVKPGRHSFSVMAVGAGGADPTPASFSFKVRRKR